MIFRKPKDKTVKNVEIKLNGLKLYRSRYSIYLGFLLDVTLSGEVHIAELLMKLIRAKAMLTKNRHHIFENQLVSLYYAIFFSHMLYGCQIWGQNENEKFFKKVEKRQKRAMKIMSCSIYDSPLRPLFKKFKILKVKDQISV